MCDTLVAVGAETYEVIPSRPFWMWGCEMGGNECGMAIGNRAATARQAVGFDRQAGCD